MTVTYSRRPSWRGVIAGLLMGLIVVMTMTALALVLGSFLSLDLRGAGITAGVYAAITALLSAFVAGYFAVKCSAPETLAGDGTAINPKDAALTGMLTAATIVFATTFFAMSGATSILGVAGAGISQAAGGVAQVASGTAGALGSAATGAAGLGISAGGALAQNDTARAAIDDAYKTVTANIDRTTIESMIAQHTQGLDQAQISATSYVIEDMLINTKDKMQALDYSDLDTWRNLDAHAKARLDEIETVLAGDEFIQRLEAQGLTNAQAHGVREEAISSYEDYKSQAETKINKARAAVDQGLQEAQEAARKAALYTGLFWLISTILTFVAAVFGAKSAASKYVPLPRTQVQ